MLIRRLNQEYLPIELISVAQRKAKSEFERKIQEGIYKNIPNPCLCGHRNDELISRTDRFGFHVDTKICLHCGLIRTDPYYDENTLKDFYDNEYRTIYNSGSLTTDVFFLEQIDIGKKIIKFIYEYLPKIGTVLEIGCGAGGILYAFKEIGKKVTGCDYGSEYITYGKGKGLNLKIGSIDDIHQKYDLIILNHVLEHITNPIDFLEAVKSKLNNNGFVFIGVPGIENIPFAYDFNIHRYLQNAHVYHFSIDTLSNLLCKKGLSPLKINKRIQSISIKSENCKEKSVNVKHIKKKLLKYERIYWINRFKILSMFFHKGRKIKSFLTKLFSRIVKMRKK